MMLAGALHLLDPSHAVPQGSMVPPLVGVDSARELQGDELDAGTDIRYQGHQDLQDDAVDCSMIVWKQPSHPALWRP